MSVLSIQNYPDTLVETWVNYSDEVLDRQHSTKYSVPRGFQDALGAENSNNRTRALELFQVGLLRGLLVNSREGDRSSMPLGWSLIQADKNVHTRLGYCAYALGRAMHGGAQLPPKIKKGFEALYTIFMLQLGFGYDGNYILIASVFRYLLRRFQTSKMSVMSDDWARRVAAAMFSTYEYKAEESALLQAYLADEEIEYLYLVTSNHGTRKVTPDQLAAANLADILPAKPGLYWIGKSQGVDKGRGVYSQGVASGEPLLDVASQIERDCFAGDIKSPFSELIDKPKDLEVMCILEKLSQAFASQGAARHEWEVIMNSLYDGVLEALQFIEEQGSALRPKRFFVHGPFAEITEESNISLEVAKDHCYASPSENDEVVVGNSHYQVTKILSAGNQYQVELALLSRAS
jgi:hypothetical protein